MKTTKSIAVFIVTHFLVYFLLSAVGCLFFKSNGQHYSYSECLGNTFWFMMYNLFIGWGIAGVVAHDYYESK